jgi:hypothetical protein
MSIKDIYWIAGFLEGDGCFCKNNTTQEIRVTQKDPWVCYKLKEMLGGSISGQTKQGLSKGNYYYRWSCNGPRARGIMMTVYSLVSPRNQERIRRMLNVWKD